MRLIDADALLKRINYKAESGMGKTIAFAFKHFIDDAPTIETHGDLISRADARKAFARINDLRTLSLGKVGEVLDSLPSADAVEVKADQLPPKVPTEWINDGMVLVPQHDWIEMQKKLEGYVSADAVHESCEDCPLYDTEKHSCPRFNKVIPRTIAEAVHGWRTDKPTERGEYMVTLDAWGHRYINIMHYNKPQMPNREVDGMCWYRVDDEWGDVVYDDNDILAWQPLPKPYIEESEVEE